MILIKNGTLVNPADNTNERLDVLVDGTDIKRIARDIPCEKDMEIIDADGCYLLPGFIDLHVHFRDPGQTHKEDILSGSKAAARGGFTTVCTMPNTNPVADNPNTIKYIIEKGKKAGLTNVLPIAAITEGMKGEKLNDIRALVEAGAIGISEDGKSVMNSAILKEAMKEALKYNIPVMSHCEDKDLVKNGVINEGEKSIEFGLPGISNAVEDVIALRDIVLAKETGAHLHLCHCSTEASVGYIEYAKKRGVSLSAECCPHHFSMCEEDIICDDGKYKMNPPLRAKKDKDTLAKGLVDGIIDTISTDHAPHSKEEKEKGFIGSPFGIVGLETAASITYTELVEKHGMSIDDMARRMSYSPARVIGIDRGDISEGKVADIVVFDPRESYEVHAIDFAGKSKNMPYEGKILKGRIKHTVFQGKIVYSHK